MARTEQGATLTEQHRQAQLRVLARALRDYRLLWPIWRPEDAHTFGLLITATLPLVRAYHRLSGSLAASYYGTFHTTEDVAGLATPRLAGPLAEAQVTASMYATGQVTAQKALRAGQPVEQARQAALVRTSGALTRHVLQGGRDTLLQSVAADTQSLGWVRVTDGTPCAFCAMLAGRGPVYKSEQSADFQAHDHCACTAEPVYKGSAWPGRGREFKQLYNQAIRDASAAGELDRGTSNDLLNAFRRAYDDGR
jgi:hypothetical protein